MGTDCKSAAFSFGGSNPPAPTKDSSIRTGYWSVCFICLAKWVARVDLNSCGDVAEDGAKTAPVQQRRPLPAAEKGRSCWGCGQQDARAAQGTMQPLGAATRVPFLRGSRNPPAPTKKPQRIKIRCGFVLPCCFCFALPSEQLGKNTVLNNKPGGGQGEGAAVEGRIPGADAVLHKGQLRGGKLLAVQGFVSLKIKPLAQPQL